MREINDAEAIEFIDKNLWEGGYFCPDKLGKERELFSSSYNTPLVSNIIDGVIPRAAWKLIDGASPTSSFFIHTKALVTRYVGTWIYINDPDNALSVIEWTKKIEPAYYNQYVMEEFERNPAVEGGISQLVLMFGDRKGIVVFLFGDEEAFKISYFGEDERFMELEKALNGS